MTRYQSTTPLLDRAEVEWWAEYSDLEERFCWVQTPWIQRFLRGRYLRRALAEVHAGDSVLEVGCGTGWLSLLLARLGRAEVTGLDFSAGQIARARAAAAAAGSPVADRVRFVEARASGAGGWPGTGAHAGQQYDVVVLHAFLHHLSTDEIGAVLNETVGRLKPGGRLVVLEPVQEPGGRSGPPSSLRRLRWLEELPTNLYRHRLRRVSPPEASARSRLDRRCRAEAPGGPSPKEHPFAPGELEGLLGRHVHLDVVEPGLSAAHLVAQEMLLARLSQPRFWGAALAPVLWVARTLDRRMMAADPKPAGVWVFYLFIGTR